MGSSCAMGRLPLPALLLLLLLLLAALRSWAFPDPDRSSCNASQQAVCGGKCIPFTWLCNGEEECPDGSDEHCEVECRGDPNAWQCKDGKCIAAAWFCDGTSDCMDGSDEENCVCSEKKVPCRDHVQCINQWEICNQHKDCVDGSDEANCPLTDCLEGQWQCKNKVCIMEDWKCNGIDNCGDSSDEGNCVYCPQGMIACDKGKCILASLMCNGVEDCLNGSDEPHTCGKNCSLDNGGCTKICTDTYWGVRCSCDPGWNLQPDGQTCADVDECALPYGPCSQICKNTVGSFICSCVEGYRLFRGTTCEVADGATKILLASNQDLVFLDIRTHHFSMSLPTRTTPSSVAYDFLRKACYWVDERKQLHVQMPGKHEILLYPDVDAVNSVSVDWFTGQLYWASNSPPAISAGLSDGRGYVKILEKKLMPEQLIVFPEKKYMYWVNRCKKGRTTIEAAGMDGSDRKLLAVVTAEDPVGLTLDYVMSRLYWISRYKKSIETIKVDGTGRYTFPETMLRVQDPLGLAVFENQFFWADKEHLLRASRRSPDVSRVLVNSSISAFTVVHELQQPQSDMLACAPGLCSHICLSSPVHPKGYRCACPEGTFLLLSGKCAELKILFSTGKVINLLQVSTKGIVLQHTPIQEWPVHIYFQDMDWSRGLIYWTDDEGELMRYNKKTKAKVIIPTVVPVCSASVDVPSGDLYWLTCDRTEIKVTTFAGMMTKTLYHSKDSILHLFLDWQRASLYWLETRKPIQKMALDGSDVKTVWNETWTEDIPITLDISSSSFFWNSKDMALKMLNLDTHKTYNLKERWTSEVAAVYGPYMVTFNKTALVVWNRRSMEPFAVNVLDVQKVVIVLDANLETVQTVPVRKPMVESTTVLATSTSAAVLPKTTTKAATVPSTTTPTTTTTTTTTPTTTTTSTTTTTATTTTVASSTTTTASKTIIVTPLFCRWGTFLCLDGLQCVEYDYICDGDDDCEDGSDEDDCGQFCSHPEVFRCENGKCIHEKYRCDGKKHCADGSDESNCWVPSPRCALRCDGDRCIPDVWLCDGTPDCFDTTDELGCAERECSLLEFRCRSGQCVSYAFRCDGDHDCNDHSDEEGCPVPIRCRGDDIKCDNGECIRKEWHCDGDMDCKDGSDEKDCKLPELKCESKQWRCNNTVQCIPDLWRCDGEVDCKDGSDEIRCELRKCHGYEFQCGQACINYTLVCNGKRDCQNGLDEGGNCAVSCQKSCSDICYRSPHGPRCACPVGYVLSRDRRTCIDINECKELAKEEKCSQTCINTLGGYNCTCHPGYLLEPDGHTCKVVGSEPKLLVAVQFDLITYGLRSMQEDVRLTDDKNLIFSIDYDLVEQKVFWMDLNAANIMWLDMKTNQKGILVKGIKSDSIAVDWVGRVLYWTDGSQGKLLATQLDGSWKENQDYAVVLDEDMGQPRSLALHPLDGLMYWSEIGSDPQIEQAGMDGSNRRILINEGLGWPTAITLDLLSWKIFWMDDKFHCIGLASLDGTGIKVFQLTEIHNPFSVSVFEDHVYWSEMKTRTVRRVDKRTGKNTAVLIKRHGQPYGLKVMHEVLQPRSSNPCAASGCSHLCLLNPNKGGSCRCPLGLVLSENGKTCIPLKESPFMFLVTQTKITQIYLKMLRLKAGQVILPDHSPLPLTRIDHLTAVDYLLRDSALYFSEWNDKLIKIITIKDPQTASWKIVKSVMDTVISLAIDWLSGNIYWIERIHPYIQVITADGRYPHVVVSTDLYQPTSVVLHPPSASMCVIDLGMKKGIHGPKLECAFMDGSKRRILWKNFQSPVGLTIVDAGTRLYWADQATGTVESIRMDGSQFRVVREGLHDLAHFTVGEGMMFWTTVTHSGPTKVWYSKLESTASSWFQWDQNLVDIKIYSKLNQQGRNGCSENNGGCRQICLAIPQGRNCQCTYGFQVRGNECIQTLRCLSTLQACKDNSRCIGKEQICNGRVDCPDGSDEANCTYTTKKPQSTSSSRRTRPQTKPTIKSIVRKSTTAQAHTSSTGPKTILTTTQKREEQTLEVVKGLGSRRCNSETCNMRGDCFVEGSEVKCTCVSGYSGDYCEEEETNSSAGAIVLSIISILLVAIVAAGAYLYLRKQQTRQRSSSTSSFKTLTIYHKDSEPEAEDNLVEDETCINEAYEPKHVEIAKCINQAYDPEHVEDETCLNEAYDPEKEASGPPKSEEAVAPILPGGECDAEAFSLDDLPSMCMGETSEQEEPTQQPHVKDYPGFMQVWSLEDIMRPRGGEPPGF